jgi:lipid A 3-O-deacylase
MPSTANWRLLSSASPRSVPLTSPVLAWWGGCLRGAILLLGFMATSLFASAQSAKPLDGKPWDLGVWAGGGFSVPGGTKDTHTFNGGVRLGKVLTGDHLGGFLRGNFEWSADLMPLYYIWQPAPAQNAYAAAFNPLNLKWNFTSSTRTVPYLELGGGVLFSNHAVPLNTSHVNFLTHATLGFQFFNSQRRAFAAGVRYEHISNAGLTTPNPGINTVQFQLGMNWFR